MYDDFTPPIGITTDELARRRLSLQPERPESDLKDDSD